MSYTPHTEEDIRQMLKVIGVDRVEELWSAIPASLQLRRALDLPQPLAEAELIQEIRSLAAANHDAGRMWCLLGAGTYYHYVPPAVDHLLCRAEFYTAYTPYQPEVSQGTLQAIFEFQTMVCEITGMEVANASMYDGASAAAEAVLMAERIQSRNTTSAVLLPRSLNPLYSRVIKTYMAHSGRPLRELPFTSQGTLALDELKKELPDALALVVQHPNYFGCLEEMEEIARLCREAEVLLIVVVTEALSLGMLEPPGSLGAALAAVEGQSLGIPMGFGGPHLGLFAAREEDVRRLPGRLVGETTDADGRRGYVLTLATREQHIRRAKATSNICTNQGMLALAASIYLSLLGSEGFARLASINRARTEYLKQALAEAGAGTLRFSAPTFNEFVLSLGRDPAPVLARLKEKGFLAGIPLARDYPELADSILVTVTEMIPRSVLDRLAAELRETLQKK